MRAVTADLEKAASFREDAERIWLDLCRDFLLDPDCNDVTAQERATFRTVLAELDLGKLQEAFKIGALDVRFRVAGARAVPITWNRNQLPDFLRTLLFPVACEAVQRRASPAPASQEQNADAHPTVAQASTKPANLTLVEEEPAEELISRLGFGIFEGNGLDKALIETGYRPIDDTGAQGIGPPSAPLALVSTLDRHRVGEYESPLDLAQRHDEIARQTTEIVATLKPLLATHRQRMTLEKVEQALRSLAQEAFIPQPDMGQITATVFRSCEAAFQGLGVKTNQRRKLLCLYTAVALELGDLEDGSDDDGSCADPDRRRRERIAKRLKRAAKTARTEELAQRKAVSRWKRSRRNKGIPKAAVARTKGKRGTRRKRSKKKLRVSRTVSRTARKIKRAARGTRSAAK